MQTIRTTVQVVDVGPEENGRKLLSFLEARLGALPAGLLMRLVRTGQVRIDGGRCKPFDRVLAGQKVRIPPITIEERKDNAPLDTSLDIVHEDNAMLLLNKPQGLPVHPGTGWTDSVHDRIKVRYPDQVFAPTPVHRLDRDTSGLLLCARTHDFLRHMHAIWHLVAKGYLCWVQGNWQHVGWHTVESELGKQQTAQGEKMVSGSGKKAVSFVHAVQPGDRESLLLVVLGTGKTHQIRVHLADCGHPIIGDPKYGHGHGLRLHAALLGWPEHEFRIAPAWAGAFEISEELMNKAQTLFASAPSKDFA